MVAPLPVPNYPADKMSFAVLARISIAAPAEPVVAAILYPQDWPKWNSFIPHADITDRTGEVPLSGFDAVTFANGALKQGSTMIMRVNMSGTPLEELPPVASLRETPEHLTLVEAIDPAKESGRRGYRIVWKLNDPKTWLMRAERVQEVVDLGDGTCEYVTWETFGGYAAWAAKWAIGGKLTERFGDWGRDLKGWVEGRIHQERTTSAVVGTGVI
jgi:hypothetical protein